MRGPLTSGLFEQDVVEAICAKLGSLCYEIQHRCATSERGYDIIAVKPRPGLLPLKLYVEAKGATSSQSHTSRYGKPFNIGQVCAHIAQALYKSAEAVSAEPNGYEIRVAIGLPDNDDHRTVASRIRTALCRWGVAVFWVTDAMVVTLESPWEA